MNRRSGQALVPVLFVVMILTALAVTLSATAKRETKAAGNHLRDAQQYLIAKGAVNYIAAELQQATSNGVTVPQLTPPPDTDANGWTMLGDGWYKVDIIDTSSRININTVDAAALNKLPAFQNDPNLAPALIDWRDTDETDTTIPQGGTGAESDYYQSLPVPYNAKNGPFDTVEELLLVRGFTPQLLYGQTGQPGVPTDSSGLDTTSGAMTTRAAKSRQGAGGPGGAGGGAGGAAQDENPIDLSGSTMPMSELFTTYSKEANYADDGTKRVNIRTASANTLTTLLTDAGVSQGQARQIVNQFTRAAQGQTQTEQSQVTALSDLLGKTNPGGIAPLVSAWPRTVLQLVADKLTVSDDDFLNGRVNINTAPPEVLATIPGMDQNLLAAIQNQQQAGGFTSINDLFQGNAFDANLLRALYGRFCVRSSVYIIRVRVRMPGSPRVYAVQTLVELPAPKAGAADTTDAGGAEGADADTAGQPGTTTTQTATQPRILQWREVPRLPGWANWAPAPNYYSGGTQPLTTGGLLGNP
jgi:general secretion pathway protein K